MAGYVKLMSGENLPDADPYKGFEVVSLGHGESVTFQKNGDGEDTCVITCCDSANIERVMYGNVYVISESGKTVASHGTNVPSSNLVSLLSNTALAAQLALLDFGDVTEVLNRAHVLNAEVNDKLVPAVGEFLAGLVSSRMPQAIEAVKYAATYLPK